MAFLLEPVYSDAVSRLGIGENPLDYPRVLAFIPARRNLQEFASRGRTGKIPYAYFYLEKKFHVSTIRWNASILTHFNMCFYEDCYCDILIYIYVHINCDMLVQVPVKCEH